MKTSQAFAVAVLVLVLGGLAFTGRGGAPGCCPVIETPYEDGTYRGIFADRDRIQVNVEFTLAGGVVTRASFRHLRRDDNYFLGSEEEPYRSVVRQYSEALEHLVGKDLRAHLADLYRPGNIVRTEVDSYTSATIRSAKVISAVRDALNRGVYSY